MAGFDDIIGHEQIIEHLQNAIELDKVSHAYIINGEKGTILTDCFGPNIYHNATPDDKYVVGYTYFDEWIGLVDEFVDCIRNGKTPKINLKWHKNTIKAMNAVYDSIATGKAIRL